MRGVCSYDNTKIRSGGGALEGGKVDAELSDVDRLIAEAQAAAEEVALAANAKERAATVSKQKDSGEAAQRTEEIQHWFSALRADDLFVEDSMFEGVFDAYEAQMNIERPPKIQVSIEALRKTGDALRKLGAKDQMSVELETKMQQIQTLHDRLFDEIQAATVDALDKVKRKFKGEETEFERRFKALSDSPLVKGLEYDKDSPEAREKALKQEIVEVILGPIAESRLKGMETGLENRKNMLNALKAEYERVKANNSGWIQRDTWGDNEIPLQFREFLGKLREKNTYDVERSGTSRTVMQEVERFFRERQAAIDTIQQAIPSNRLAFEMNRMIIDETLAEVHDEEALRETFVALRTFLNDARTKTANAFNHERTGEKFPFTNPTALLILGRLQQYGADLPGFYIGSHRTYDTIPYGQQLVGRQIDTGEQKAWTQADSLGGYAARGFVRAKLTKTTDEYAGTGFGTNPDSAGQYYDELRSRDERGQAIKRAYPTKEEYLQAMFSGETKFFNMRMAYDKAAAGLVKDKTRSTKQPSLGGTDALKVIGWKESKLGALVEPGQSVSDTDRTYALYLERFTKPQVNAEALFDIRDAEGKFHVYTTDQAVSLLRRARRDARDMVLNVDRALAEGQAGIVSERAGIASERGSIETQIATLRKQVEEAQSALAAREREVAAEKERLTKQLNTDVGREREIARASQAYYENQITKAGNELEALAQRLREELRAALASKSGFFGGEKAFREAVTRIVESLPSKKE